MDINIFVKYFIGLLAIINPVGLVPVFISLTDGLTSHERLHINFVANLSVAIILIISMLAGRFILECFSISIDSFRIAGGVVIILVAVSMIQGRLENGRRNPEESAEASTKDSIAIVPLAMPLMAGPGAISSTIVFSGQMNSSVIGITGSIIVIGIFSLCSFVIFSLSQFMFRGLL